MIRYLQEQELIGFKLGFPGREENRTLGLAGGWQGPIRAANGPILRVGVWEKIKFLTLVHE
jgi:hypothetical protein